MKIITSIHSFEKISQNGDEAIYDCVLACGCRQRTGYREREPQVGGWAECSCGIVDNHTRAFCTDAERVELKRALHDSSNVAAQTALAALLYAYRHQCTRYGELIRKLREQNRRPRFGGPMRASSRPERA